MVISTYTFINPQLKNVNFSFPNSAGLLNHYYITHKMYTQHMYTVFFMMNMEKRKDKKHTFWRTHSGL